MNQESSTPNGNIDPEVAAQQASEANAKAAAEAGAAAAEAKEAPAAEARDPAEEWKSRTAYLMAEIENMRKRFAREKSDVIRLANEELLKAILPVLDNLQLATKAVKEAKTPEDSVSQQLFGKLLQGVEMTMKHFEQTLERVGVQTVGSVGESFDPEKHEAIAQSEQADRRDGEVTAEMQKGYLLNGRLLRPARVVVNKSAKTDSGVTN